MLCASGGDKTGTKIDPMIVDLQVWTILNVFKQMAGTAAKVQQPNRPRDISDDVQHHVIASHSVRHIGPGHSQRRIAFAVKIRFDAIRDVLVAGALDLRIWRFHCEFFNFILQA